MYSAEIIKKASEKARKAKRSIRDYLPGANTKRRCGCNKCWPYGYTQRKQTVARHRNQYGVHPEAKAAASLAPFLADTTNPPPLPLIEGSSDDLGDASMKSRESGSECSDQSSQHFNSPPYDRSSLPAWSRPGSPSVLDQMPIPQIGSPACSRSILSSRSEGLFQSGSNSGSRSHSPSLPQYLCVCSSNESSSSPSYVDSDWDSDYEDPHLQPIHARADVDFFGQALADLLISGTLKPSPPPGYAGTQDCIKDANGEDDDLGDPPDRGEPENPDDPDGAEVDGVVIQVPPDDAGGAPGDPGDDNAGWNIPALDEHPTLRNIYLRTWVQYAFHGVTQKVIQEMLESHKSALLAGVDFYPPEFIEEANNMPTTLRSLECRLGLDFSELLITYALCPECGKRYTMEELYALQNPQCLRHVGDQCSGNLYIETTLVDGTRKRTPNRSMVYNPPPDSLGRILSRIGIVDSTQHWRGNDPNNAPLENPPEPRDPRE